MNGRECHLVVHCCADLHSVHGFRCYDNRALNAKCQRVLVLALCLVMIKKPFVLLDVGCATEDYFWRDFPSRGPVYYYK